MFARATRPFVNTDFAHIWAASTVSELGSQVSLIALPFVAIATLHASTFQVAALGAAGTVPWLLFALPAGVWIDRLPRRPVMIVADVGRALALGSIPAAYAARVLTIWQLLAVGLVTGTCTVFFDVASQSFLPLVVPRSRLADGNASLQTSVQGAQLVGPGFGGALVSVLGAPFAVIVDALSFLGSAVLVTRVRRAEAVPPRSGERGMVREIREGLRYVLGHPIMRPNLTYLVTANVFNYIFLSVLLLFAVRELGLSPRQVGLTLSLAGVGSLAGALLTTRLQRKLGLGRVMLLTAFGGCGLLLIPFASGAARIPLLAGGLFLWGVGVVVYQATSVAIAQATTPAHLMARTHATRRFVARSTIPLWLLLGGVLGTYLGLRTTMLIGTGGRALAGLIIFASPVRSIRSLDDADALVRLAPI